MTNRLPIYLPARTLLLAASETLPALALLVWFIGESHSDAWVWLRYENGFLRIATLALTFFTCMYYHDLYEWPAVRNLHLALARLPEVLGTACLALAALYMVAPGTRLRLAAVLLAMTTFGLGVALARQIHLAITRSDRLSQNLVLVGRGRLAAELSRIIASRPELGIRLPDRVPDEESAAVLLGRGAKPTANRAGSLRIDGLILASGAALGTADGGPATAAMQMIDGPALYEKLTGKVWLDSLDPNRLRGRSGTIPSPLSAVGTRTLAILFSLIALLLAIPLMAAIALAIWMDSGSPVIFRQRRAGQNGCPFTLYKFRSMSKGDHGRFRPAEKDDQRVTHIGRWLRRTRLDELPQLWNILRGDMSLLGPRPFAWEEERKWAWDIPWYTERWRVKPGATGWAQIRHGYCSTREDNIEKLAYDLFYIKNRSVALDLMILLETTKTLLKGRGAR